MKSLVEYFNQLSEGYVQRKNNIVILGGLKLQFWGDHVFYIVKGGPDLSIYKDGGFKPQRSNEIYAKDAITNGVPKDIAASITVYLNTPKNQQEQAIQKVVQDLENFAGKHLAKKPANEAQVSEGDAMSKMKITTQVDLDETEGLWNTTNDRWSRRAKHQLSKNELQGAADFSQFAKGDNAVYEGQEVEVRIPIGPNGTTGIMLEGHLKMVNRSKLQTLEEASGVMGGMKPLGPLNRIMQLAGLEHSGSVVETEEETETLVDSSQTDESDAEEILDEAANAGTMFNQLLMANNNNPAYKNNPTAAKVATVGQVLAGLESVIGELPTDLPQTISSHIKMVPGIGAELIKAAGTMTKPTT